MITRGMTNISFEGWKKGTDSSLWQETISLAPEDEDEEKSRYKSGGHLRKDTKTVKICTCLCSYSYIRRSLRFMYLLLLPEKGEEE